MSPLAVQAAWTRALASQFGPGETVTLVRAGNAGPFYVHAFLTGFVPEEVAAGVQQGKRRAFVLASDVAASGFPLPFIVNQDRLIWGVKTNAITKIDDATVREQAITFAYTLDLEGA